ncbi:MAG: ATP-binding protein [bacterium]|nr:ATP-binding protein [bacterium]
MRNQHQITRSAELESLSILREFIEKACKQHKRIDDHICYDLKLAVDEACTNIITHGYAGMNPGSIILSLEMAPNKVVVTITDFGHPFEPSEASAPDVEAGLEDLPIGGFGLFFIYQTMDEINYETTEDGNHLTFIKQLST